jgi:hypothetical protein
LGRTTVLRATWGAIPPAWALVCALGCGTPSRRGSPGPDCEPTSSPPSKAATFTEVAELAHVAYREGAPVDGFSNCIVKNYCDFNLLMGSAAVGDYDGDGFPDLYVSRTWATPILFHNERDGTFRDATASSGIGRFTSWSGAAWLDIDNDGDLDLMAQAAGTDRHYLYVNQGNGTFTEEAHLRGVALDDGLTKLATSVAVGDYNRDGWLDIHLSEWSTKGLLGYFGDPKFPPPDRPGHTRLFRNMGASNPGHFEDVTLASGALTDPPGADGLFTRVYSFGNAFADFDGDDWPDLAITGDFSTSRFFWNNQGSFVEKTIDSGLGRDQFGMGSAIADLDADGKLDWLVTSIGNGPSCIQGFCGNEHGNHLYRYAQNRMFEDVGEALGIHDGGWSWGAAMIDVDNDGDLDVAQTNGIEYPFVPPGAIFTVDPNRLWLNENGSFVESAAALNFADTRRGKGLVTFDYDRDGDLDVFVANNADTPNLFRNDIPQGDYLRVRVVTQTGRDAIGATVTIQPTPSDQPRVAVIGLGTHFLGQSESTAHFGLGKDAPPVTIVSVHWHDTGITKVLKGVSPNQELVVTP